jgi:hypothetical protein
MRRRVSVRSCALIGRLRGDLLQSCCGLPRVRRCRTRPRAPQKGRRASDEKESKALPVHAAAYHGSRSRPWKR